MKQTHEIFNELALYPGQILVHLFAKLFKLAKNFGRVHILAISPSHHAQIIEHI
jgi:hypothetical protein